MQLPVSLIPPLYTKETCHSARDADVKPIQNDTVVVTSPPLNSPRDVSDETSFDRDAMADAPLGEEIVVTMVSTSNYANMTVKKLRDECKSMNLDSTGNKKDLIERLTKHS